MEQFCYFITLGKQQAVLPGNCLEYNGADHINDHAYQNRPCAENHSAADAKGFQPKPHAKGAGTHYSRGKEATEHIFQDAGGIFFQYPAHGNEIQHRDAQIAQQAAQRGTQNADVGIAGGAGEGLLFRRGEVLRKVPQDKLVEALMEEIEKL